MQPKRITRKRGPWLERFWAKVDRNGPIPAHRSEFGPCWLWLAYTDPAGYGRFSKIGRNPEYSHVISYEESNGPVPDGLELDHLCHNGDSTCQSGRKCGHRRCLNPEHLEAVPHRVNALRGNGYYAQSARKAPDGPVRKSIPWAIRWGTHCKRGHPRTPENTHVYVGKHRTLRQCDPCRRQALEAMYTKRRHS